MAEEVLNRSVYTEKNNSNSQDGSAKPLISISSEFGHIFLPLFLSGFILITFTLIAVFTFFIHKSINKSLNEINDDNSIILSFLADEAANAVSVEKYAKLAGKFQFTLDRQKNRHMGDSIKEIFLLDKSGVILAHNDITKITNDSKSMVNKISGVYSNELFQSALLLKNGKIASEIYPYDVYKKNRQYLYLFHKIMPENYFHTVDFATPVYKNGKPKSTLHLVITYDSLDNLIHGFVQELFFSWSIGMGILLIAVLGYTLKTRNKLHKIDNLLKVITVIPSSNKFKEEIKYIDKKIHELELKSRLTGVYSGRSDIKDAILIKD